MTHKEEGISNIHHGVHFHFLTNVEINLRIQEKVKLGFRRKTSGVHGGEYVE
jgi:hypothetical protein